MTARLYYADAYLRSFDAQVLSAQPHDENVAVVLDRTAFYPTGGGQLHDLGTLRDEQTQANVIDVLDENGEVVHVLDRPVATGRVHGELDWPRRWDLTQQHTGQHILSQAFYQLFEAETIAVHMTESNCTLDLLRQLTTEQHAQAEELANQIVQSNRPVRAAFVGDEELARMPLRKPPAAKHEKIRIVEVSGFDWSPCGGTHVRATGEVGLIKILGAERRASEQRIEFGCGMRALRDYRWKNQAIRSLAAQLSVKDSDLASTVQQLIDDGKETRRQMNALRARLLEYEAEQLWDAAKVEGAWHWVQQVFEGRSLDEARLLAIKLRNKASAVVLFAVAGEKPNLIFARSADLSLDMGKLMHEVSGAFGGRGGGQPELAQGGVANGSDLAQVLNVAAAKIRQMG